MARYHIKNITTQKYYAGATAGNQPGLWGDINEARDYSKGEANESIRRLNAQFGQDPWNIHAVRERVQ